MFNFKNYLAATTLDEAYNELVKNKKNIILGGTAYLRMGNVTYNTAIDLSNLGLNYVKESDDYIHIGAMVSFRDLETNEITKTIFDGILDRCVRGIIGVQFRSNVTVGATVFSKYGFSDLIPTLLSMGAIIVLHHGGELSLEEYLKEKELRRDILVEIKIKKEEGKGSFQSIRKSKTDYAIINTCVVKRKEGIKIAIGVRPGKAVLAYRAMEILNSKEITEELIDKACISIDEEITFGSNMRGTAEYRQAMAKALVKRAIKEVL